MSPIRLPRCPECDWVERPVIKMIEDHPVFSGDCPNPKCSRSEKMDDLGLAEKMWSDFKYYATLPEYPQVKRETKVVGGNLGVSRENIDRACLLVWDRIKNIHAALTELRADPDSDNKYRAIGELYTEPFTRAVYVESKATLNNDRI